MLQYEIKGKKKTLKACSLAAGSGERGTVWLSGVWAGNQGLPGSNLSSATYRVSDLTSAGPFPSSAKLA